VLWVDRERRVHVLEQPVDVALALPTELRDQLILTTGLAFLAALVVVWVTTRRVVKPTEELTAAAERMAGGDLASPIAVRAEDEIGRLAESLEAMRRRLRAATEAIERTNRELEQRVAERTSRLGQLLRGTISAQEEERRRLARELHDETAQTLAALSISLDRARDALADGPPPTLERVNEARAIAARLLAETRRLIQGLRPAVLDDLGLLPAIRWYAESALGDAGVAVTIESDAPAPRLPAHMEVALFRIAQEAVTNVAKHAEARHATVALHVSDSTATVSVVDDGRGFDVARTLGQDGPHDESVGLIGMQERVRLLNGNLEIRSVPGAGTVVRVSAPIEEAD
jgi:signal transduction histidine kinase